MRMMTGIGKTHIGKIRKKNQDTILVENQRIGPLERLYIVADGMGGHKAGEVASGMAVEQFCGYLRDNPDIGQDGTEQYLRNAVLFANEKILSASMDDPETKGMGTTISLVAAVGETLCFAHVGDSRIYMITKSAIKPVSQDHSFVAEMVRMGKLTEEEARTHPKKNVLTRALGTDSQVSVDTGVIDLPEDGKLMICSDGLSNMVTDGEILSIINNNTPEAAVDALVELALQNGGSDNISLIIIS